MIKVSTFLAESVHGLAAVPLFGEADGAFEKVASAGLLPEVMRYIGVLRPKKESQYVLVNALGAGEYFGCFPSGTLVETQDGEQNIEEIEPGTLVRTHLNRFRRVLARTPRQAEELCDIYVQGLPSNVPSLTATPNHELWVITREDFLQTKRRIVWKGDTSSSLDDRRQQALLEMEFSWVALSDVRPGDMVAEPFPLDEDPSALGDEKWNCPAVAFLMGLYAAEGCTVTRAERPGVDHYLVLVTSNEENDTLTRARSAAEQFGHKLWAGDLPETHSRRLELHWQEFSRLCATHIGKHALGKKLSSALLRMPREWQLVFFNAYCAGDGCVRPSGKEVGAVRCSSASAALLRGIRLLLARQGFVASINGRHNKKASWYNGNPIYELNISGGQFNGRSTTKSYLHPDGFILSAVKKVEQYDWEGEVYDLTVEEDSSFVASGVAVHNSNVNGDHFPEEALMHSPDGWTGNPLIDKELSKNWPYGFPTFYNAHPFAHHKNKDPSRAYGEVELAVWNDHMKRVELVVRVDHDKCVQFGGTPVWDRLKQGQFPDVSMGCLPAGSLITMADGTQKSIERVQETEWVLTHTGGKYRVTETMSRPHKGTIFRFKVYGFRRELVLTGNHPLWLVDGEQMRCQPISSSDRAWATKELIARQRHCMPFVRAESKGCATCSKEPHYEFEWRRTDEAQVGDYLAFPVPSELDDSLDSKELARFLGYYLAEGHVSNYNNRFQEQINFSLNYEEKDLAEEIEQLARSLGVEVLWHREKPDAGARTVSVVSKKLAELCLKWCGAGAKTKSLSKEILYARQEFLMEFLGAYLNGDGGTYKGSAYFSTSSEALSHQLFIALARCELIASVNKIDHRPSERSVVRKDTVEYQVWIGTDYSWKLKQYISKPVRKSEKVRGQRFFYELNGQKFLMAPIVEIYEEEYDDFVYNFSVEHDESYVAESLAVHNSKVPWDLCFPAGTLVRTEEGHVPIEEVREGQRVLTHVGGSQLVKGTLVRTSENILQICAGGLPNISATPNHPFLVLRKEDVRTCQGSANGQRLRHQLDGLDPCRRCGRHVELFPDWVAAEDLRVGDYVATPLPLPLPDRSRAAHSAKLLGYYLGDGYVVSQKTGKRKDGERRDMGVGFSVGDDDCHLPQLLSLLSETGQNEPRVYEDRKGARAVDVVLYNQELAAWVQHMGGRGSRGKRLADEVFTWSREEILDLVAGYVDTDGSFDEKCGSVRIASVNRGLLLDVQRLLLGARILCSVHRGGTTDGGDYWYLFLPAYGAQALLGRSCKVSPRDAAWQASKVFLYGGFAWFPVEALEEVEGPVAVYNISVDYEESYVAEGRAVHNCSICGDWDLYKKALATFNPSKHRHAGIAVLEFHKKLKAKNGVGIRGLSITRSDYCDHASKLMNRIFPDGRKSFVYNFFPRFFDISFVFIGADRTAKVMVFIVQSGRSCGLPSALTAEKMGLTDDGDDDEVTEKTASAMTDAFDEFLLKGAAEKQGTIEKEVVPSQFAGKAVPLLTESEKDLPDEAMNALCSVPMSKALATLTGLGMVLRPREFANLSERRGNDLDVGMDEDDFMPGLARLLRPLMHARSALGPYIERRVVIISSSPKNGKEGASSLPPEELRKIGAAYGDYRRKVMELVASAQQLIKSAATSSDRELHKLAEASAEDLFTPLSYCYLDGAFRDEAPFAIQREEMVEKVSVAGVERGLPSRNTWTRHPMIPGGDFP